jgi:hypothetical protein
MIFAFSRKLKNAFLFQPYSESILRVRCSFEEMSFKKIEKTREKREDLMFECVGGGIMVWQQLIGLALSHVAPIPR